MRKVSLVKFKVFFLYVLLLVVYGAAYLSISEFNQEKLGTVIWILSVMGWIQYVFSLSSWWKLTDSFFSVYSIYITFSYLFTYGQCLMWGIGIHLPNEIGKVRLYSWAIPSQSSIIQTQLITLIGLLSFHTGAVLLYKRRVSYSNIRINTQTINIQENALYRVCQITNLISTPLMFYSVIRNIFIIREFGYGATLYNAEVVATQNNIVMLLRMMYIPSIFGMLIASRYKRQVYKTCYISFGFYTVLSLFAGDRGEWLFPLCLLLWMHHKYCNRINLKRVIKYSVMGFALITICVAVRNSRTSGVRLSGVVDAIAGESNPIVSGIFELGSSMRPTLIIMQNGWKTYPYGNSYIHALLGMITERVIKLYQPNYSGLSTWFSQSYIGISYGAGFSFIAEAIMNFGPYGSIVILLVLGMLSSRCMFSVESSDYTYSPVSVFFQVSTIYAMLQGIRNTMLTAGKTWFFSTVLIMLLYYLYFSLLKRRKKTVLSEA